MADKEENIEAQGLVGYSYDHLLAIRKRIRKISDFTIPIRGGLTYAQAGTALATFVVMFFVYAVVALPIMIVTDTSPLGRLGILVTLLFVPPILVAQRMIAPMPDGKTIGGWVRSWTRFTFDDKVHRRGRPIDTPRTHQAGRVRHYLKTWEPAEEFANNYGTDKPLTRVEIERSFTGEVVDLGSRQEEFSRRLRAEELVRSDHDVDAADFYDLRHADAAQVIGL